MRLQRISNARRGGAAVVEAAIVIPVLLLLLYGIFSGALLVFAADEVSAASREGARYASVRGHDYQWYTGKPAATADEIKTAAMNHNVLLDKSKATVTVTWDSSNRTGHYVTVEVKYQWKSIGIFKDREFVSRSTMMITY